MSQSVWKFYISFSVVSLVNGSLGTDCDCCKPLVESDDGSFACHCLLQCDWQVVVDVLTLFALDFFLFFIPALQVFWGKDDSRGG